MPTVINLCNGALTLIGAARISSLTEASREARICREIYEDIRDEVLRSHPFGFATKVVELAQDTSEDPVDFAYAYVVPSDCLRVIGLVDEVDDVSRITVQLTPIDEGKKYERRGRHIMTDLEEVFLKYTAKITDPEMFDSLFVQAFKYRMAADLAMAIIKKVAVHDRMLQRFAQVIKSARGVDASEDRLDRGDSKIFVDARL